MHKMKNSISLQASDKDQDVVLFSEIINGNPLEIGSGFKAAAFRERDYRGAMDPLIMVDHYRMTEPTFGAHPHAGLSAVTVVLEDSVGKLHNRDSLGNDFDLSAGDLYWLKAGSGIVHDEAPREGARIHGLQVFVNLPAKLKHSTPESIHVRSGDIPIIEQNGVRVRVILGESNGVISQSAPALPMSILEGRMQSEGRFSQTLGVGKNAWLYVMDGKLDVKAQNKQIALTAGQSVSIMNVSAHHDNEIELTNVSENLSKFVIFIGAPIKEDFVQQGPFVMSTEAEIEQVQSDYQAGKLGKLSEI